MRLMVVVFVVVIVVSIVFVADVIVVVVVVSVFCFVWNFRKSVYSSAKKSNTHSLSIKNATRILHSQFGCRELAQEVA